MKKTALKILSVLALTGATILSGCGEKPKDSSSPAPAQGNSSASAATEINFWGGWTGPDGDVMKSMVEQFNKENPNIKVNLTTMQWSPLFEKLVTQAKVGNPPALMAMHAQDVAQFAKLGILDPDAAAKVPVKKEEFNPTAWDSAFYQGKQMAVPLDMHMHGLYINEDMFKKAGLDPAKPPKTGAELVDYATKLTVDANGKHPNDPGFDINNVKQWGLGIPNNHHGFYMWFALMAQQGEKLTNDDGTKSAFDQAKGEKAWQWLSDLVFKDKVAPKGEKAPFDDFKAGLTAMVVDGPWQLPALEGQDKMKWTTAPFPKVFDQEGSWGSGHILTFPKIKDEKKREAALTLAQWIVKHSDQWAKSGNIPASLEVQKNIQQLPGRKAFIDMMSYTKVLPNIPKSAQAYSAKSPSPIMNAAQGILLENKNPAEITKALKADLDGVLGTP